MITMPKAIYRLNAIPFISINNSQKWGNRSKNLYRSIRDPE
jgi:hypothetical protein